MLQVDNRRFGLVVDQVQDAEEIVVKPLSKHLKGIRAYAGATIMGDGKLALILDVLGIASAAGITADTNEVAIKKEVADAQFTTDQRQKFVLFCGPGPVHETVVEYFDQVDHGLVPLLDTADKKKIEGFRRNVLVPIAQRHAQAVDELIQVANQRVEAHEKTASATVVSRTWIMIIVAVCAIVMIIVAHQLRQLVGQFKVHADSPHHGAEKPFARGAAAGSY